MSSLNPDGFNVRKFADTVHSQFAPMARPFYSAKGKPWIGHYHAINENHSGLDIIYEAFPFAIIIGPGAGAQAEPAVIGDA